MDPAEGEELRLEGCERLLPPTEVDEEVVDVDDNLPETTLWPEACNLADEDPSLTRFDEALR